jgi:hypothetical protein
VYSELSRHRPSVSKASSARPEVQLNAISRSMVKPTMLTSLCPIRKLPIIGVPVERCTENRAKKDTHQLLLDETLVVGLSGGFSFVLSCTRDDIEVP